MFTEKPQVEVLSKNKERLLALEKTGKFVFHGSMDVINELQPRQAENAGEKHGEPAVFATPFAEAAIFRSLINADKLEVKGESDNEFGIGDDGLHFSASENLLAAARGKIGRIYVLDKGSFKDLEPGRMECRSFETVKPIEVIEITFDDLPKGIKIVDPSKHRPKPSHL